ncbi:DUF4384 domain-containing protein [Pseudolysobacter antarcticus]|uniref:mitogen-activated protein kinase kinase n=1 Tax=Pseudolysobacter antarcticus TaxID=2511995 RepID=A0A411HLS8_9GAMM|nr:serine/threonine-protein kinase [Pseudolysobacter antarcticus]QBB71461.1 DUF4384 domain-containing protein [Pseudolysobacter antarcticus]
MTPQELELERLATLIADDEPVNWRELDPSAQRDNAQTFSGLRELEQLAQGFRRVSVAGNERVHNQRPGKFRFGQLEALEQIGEGMQGEVWRAYDALLDQCVALKLRKIESGELAHQFLDEARRLARVRHANIVSVYGAAIHDGRAGIWTELVTGKSLASVLAEQGPLPVDEARAIGIDLCHALAVVHRHGLVHGDIKPENVMRDHGGRIVLMDFGATREFIDAHDATVLGTPNYLAPEVLRGATPTPASDVYALGVLLFRLATGEYPPTLNDTETSLASDTHDAWRKPIQTAGLPRDFARAIERALDHDPLRRPASALAFAAALAPSALPTNRIRHWSFVAVATALIAAVVFGLVRWRAVPVVAWNATAGFQRVDTLGATALADGVALAFGDRLMLKFESNQPAYVYVFNDDGSGQAAVLFPLPGLDPGNPLAANSAHQLPGKSGLTPLSWQVNSSAAREEFVVLAADAPQPELERAIAEWQHAGALPNVAVRGATQLAPAPNDVEISSASLHALLGRIEPQTAAHLRRWRFVFPHAPSPS